MDGYVLMQISIYAKTLFFFFFFTVYIVQEQKETIKKKSGQNINKKYLCVLEFWSFEWEAFSGWCLSFGGYSGGENSVRRSQITGNN